MDLLRRAFSTHGLSMKSKFIKRRNWKGLNKGFESYETILVFLLANFVAYNIAYLVHRKGQNYVLGSWETIGEN
jgi:hypothetical protein